MTGPREAAGTGPAWPPGVMGYVDRPSAAPGEALDVHVSCDTAELWTGDLVRLLSADLAPEGPPFREREIASVVAVQRRAIEQVTPVGSYGRAPAHPALAPEAGLTVSVLVMPTVPGEEEQTLVCCGVPREGRGWLLAVGADGAAELTVATPSGPATLTSRCPMVAGCWYRVVATIGAGALRLEQAPTGTREANRLAVLPDGHQPVVASVPLPSPPVPAADAPVLLAAGAVDAAGCPRGCFTGRLGRVALVGGASDEVLAAWDPARGIGPRGIEAPSVLHDTGPHGVHVDLVNRPTRAVTGPAWDGTEHCFRHAPEHYAAIHFHRDDLADCAWEPQWRLELPNDLPSGLYAVRVRAAGFTDRIPFVVRPRRGTTSASTLLVLPTNSYLAYANDHVATDSPRVQMLMRRVPELDEHETYRNAHREFGSSMYEVHEDGTGISLSTWRRPILTMRPNVRLFNARAWQFTGDLQLIDWLDRSGRDVDIVCDLDLHREGKELLQRYACVLTGTHPEYVSGAMLDAWEAYVRDGGRLVYLGGNGMYWVTGFDPEDPAVVEIRRWGGTEAWRAAPGEHHLASTGEMGGLWRNRGRAPQKLVGIGFVAQGLDAAAGFRRTAQLDPRAAWVLDGVGDDRFGFFGTMGGAAGMEIDATDPTLGTPLQAVVIASSEGHSDDMLEARENYGMTPAAPGGARNPRVRADMVLVPWPGGGGVFAPGSITWAGSLAHQGYENPVARIMASVLDRFASGAPLFDG